MQACLICGRKISTDRELCEEHRILLKAIVDSCGKDPEMQKRWENVLELARGKVQAACEQDEVDVFAFIDEIIAETSQGK